MLIGRFEGLRQDEAQRRLEELGARVTGSVTGRTDLAFVDSLHYNDGKKLQEARKRSIPIFDDEALRALLAAEDAPDRDEPQAGAVSDLVALRARLLKLEREQGITEEHRAATRELRESQGALLRHPYGHKAEINDYALSPCGRYLATGTLTGDDYGGSLQIWEMVTGRCVNVIGIEGGIGRSGYERSIQWSADSRRIGLAYNTHHIGVFDPFSPFLGSVTLAECLITDGLARPVPWALAPDGNQVFVNSGTPCEVGGCIVPMESGELHWTSRDATPGHPFLLVSRLREDLRTEEMDAHDGVTSLRTAGGRRRWTRFSPGPWMSVWPGRCAGESSLSYRTPGARATLSGTRRTASGCVNTGTRSRCVVRAVSLPHLIVGEPRWSRCALSPGRGAPRIRSSG